MGGGNRSTMTRLSVNLPLLLFLSAGLPSGATGQEVLLTSAGSTFIYPILGKWIREYTKIHPELKIAYEPVGSGRGISRTLAGTVDFGASDGPMTDQQLKRAQKPILHVPVVLGAVVPAYNLPGLQDELRFTPEIMADIYLGKIVKWNDPALARANPTVKLPAHEILVFFRTDGSGTTYIWTDYLSKTSAEWKRRIGVGTSVSFPIGVGVAFNEGVVEEIKKRPYSFGYLQSTYAIENRVAYGSVENPAGRFVKASSVTIVAAAAAAEMPPDFRISITNGKADGAYPISSFTWLLVPERIDDAGKRHAISEFLRWVLTDGQRFAAAKNYAPLPEDVARRVLKAISTIR
jgi:phosphate transport system substrate-binding protein